MSFNNVAKKFNVGLSALCDEMSSELKDATIVYTDVYTIKYDLIANYTKYGESHTLNFELYLIDIGPQVCDFLQIWSYALYSNISPFIV